MFFHFFYLVPVNVAKYTKLAHFFHTPEAWKWMSGSSLTPSTGLNTSRCVLWMHTLLVNMSEPFGSILYYVTAVSATPSSARHFPWVLNERLKALYLSLLYLFYILFGNPVIRIYSSFSFAFSRTRRHSLIYRGFPSSHHHFYTLIKFARSTIPAAQTFTDNDFARRECVTTLCTSASRWSHWWCSNPGIDHRYHSRIRRPKRQEVRRTLLHPQRTPTLVKTIERRNLVNRLRHKGYLLIPECT